METPLRAKGCHFENSQIQLKVDTRQVNGMSKYKTTQSHEDVVTFKIVTVEATDDTDEEYVTRTVPRFRGGTTREWLAWIPRFMRVKELKEWKDAEATQLEPRARGRCTHAL